MNAKSALNDLIPLTIVIALLALLPIACTEGLERQANADYEQCLSWQADGHTIRCDMEKYK